MIVFWDDYVVVVCGFGVLVCLYVVVVVEDVYLWGCVGLFDFLVVEECCDFVEVVVDDEESD